MLVEDLVSVRISSTRLHKSIDELSRVGRQPGGGITRRTFSEADIQAREYVTSLMRDAELDVEVDEFANITGRTRGFSHEDPAVLCGSHIDTVPNGGPLDGAYGVLAGIEAIRTIHEQELTIKKPLAIVVFTEEEGARFHPFLGSAGFTGTLNRDTAYALKDEAGVTFHAAMSESEVSQIRLVRRPENPFPVNAYVELHIEQGPVLETERVPIGVVDVVVGNGDLVVEVEGSAAHAGTTPMSTRRDALIGASKMILGIHGIAQRAGSSSVATVGSLTISPNASNVVPGKVVFTVDFRDPTLNGMNFLQCEIASLAKKVGMQEDLKVSVTLRDITKPAKMSTRVMHTIEAAANSLGLSHKRMHSGAGHDCQNMSQVTETGMIFVPSHEGLSHVPTEFTAPQHLEAGANVLLETLLRLANE